MNQFDKIEGIAELEENWDGYQSSSFSPVLIDNVKWILQESPNLLSDFFICPCSGGQSIQFELQCDKKELEIEVFEDKIVYLKVYDSDDVRDETIDEGEFEFKRDEETLKKIHNLVYWLI